MNQEQNDGKRTQDTMMEKGKKTLRGLVLGKSFIIWKLGLGGRNVEKGRRGKKSKTSLLKRGLERGPGFKGRRCHGRQ